MPGLHARRVLAVALLVAGTVVAWALALTGAHATPDAAAAVQGAVLIAVWLLYHDYTGSSSS